MSDVSNNRWKFTCWVTKKFLFRINLIIADCLQIWLPSERFSRMKAAAPPVRAARCRLIKERRESSSTLADTIGVTLVCSPTNHARSARVHNDIRKRSVKHQLVSQLETREARNIFAWNFSYPLQFPRGSWTVNFARSRELASLMIIYAIINCKWPK